MFDINFFQKTHGLKKRILKGHKINENEIFEHLEAFRDPQPIVYNIETTNACNMTCKMCPRTTMMTRKVSTIDQQLFDSIVTQLKPFTAGEWEKWEKFIQNEYHISPNDMSENHFFLYIIPKVIQLHGYGDPLLDKDIVKRVKKLDENGFETYFSCNPANINVDLSVEIMKSGLDYIKYSIESVDDVRHKKIRGKLSNFQASYKKINQLLDIKKKNGLTTTFIITMLDLGLTDQEQEYEKLRNAFEGKDVYIYLKSQDQQWYEKKEIGTKSLHWIELCQHPWMSMTVKSDGKAAMCMEDFNNEIILGDSRLNSLYDIWNGDKYYAFRRVHVYGAKGIKCSDECDMKLFGDSIN